MPRVPDDLQSITAQIGDVRRRLVVLDFDGTLAPIVEHPGDAVLAEGAGEALSALAEVAPVVVLSGRPIADLLPRLGPHFVGIVVGGHGAEIRLADGDRVELVDVASVRQTLDRLQDELTPLLDPDHGWLIERKDASLAVHHRRVTIQRTEELLPEVRRLMEARADDPPGFEVLEGKAILELRPVGVDKGTAMAWLESRFPDRPPLVLGDDVTDEDAFAAARARGGDAILVSELPRPTAARWRLDGPERVTALLRGLRHHGGGLASRPVPTTRFHAIGDYGMIGDSRTAALVAPDGSIDFFCSPRFDSPTLFAALLDPLRGGRWRIRPTARLDVQRTYVGETNVLVSRFVRGSTPVVTLTDFFVYSRVNAGDPHYAGHVLLRRLEATEDVELELELQPRFDYARRPTELRRTDVGVRATCGDERADLRFSGPALEISPHEDGNGDVARCRWVLRAGETCWCRLYTGDSGNGPHAHLSDEELFDLTVRTWARWAQDIDYRGPWRDDVVRSALVLKGLVYEPSGALVAAPTTSLPEEIGGERNWDYRFAWIRDSAYVLECFLRIGHTREAETFIRWLSELTRRIGGARSVRPLYRVTGEDDLAETALDHFEGYRGSRPVRIGNGAAAQLQLDIYGAATQLAFLTQEAGGPVPGDRWSVVRDLVDAVAERWQEPDAGLWEVRSSPKHHTYSKFQCWLALDRAVRIGRGLGLRGPYDRWRAAAEEIHASILRHGYDHELGSFVQVYGERAVDAALLQLPLRGFIPPSDPRVRSTVTAIRRELEVADGLLLRYRGDDGLDGDEGAFLMCSFWLVELLARMGDLQEAVRLFERLRSLAAPLGLFAEQIDPQTHEHLGNFPQGFSHMALIGAATAIDEELRSRSRSIATIRRD